MILSNVEIVRCLDESLFRIDGIVERDPTRAPFNTSAVDLRLGNEVVILGEDMPAAIDLRSGSGIARFLQAHSRRVVITNDSPFTLTKGKFVLANTLERVEFPLSTSLCYSARVEGKSSLARCGILIHFTAPTIHAGFGGHITLEMINLSDINFLLYPSMYICQLIVEEVKGKPQQAPNQFAGQTDPVGVTS
jgi:dCTP deaminase